MNVFDLPVHPAAAIFPMLCDEEIEELAADIKAHGLRNPIIVKDGQVIDGRNRREACKRAGVAPRIEELNGADPIAYIVSANIARRHLSKGQRAMAIATLYPQPEKGGRGKKNSLISKEFSTGSLSQARTVLAVLPDVAAAVLAGDTSLSDAYAEALKARADLDSDIKRRERLRDRAPDLADLVDEGRVALLEAESIHATRQEDRRRQRLATLEVVNGLDRLLDVLAEGKRRAAFLEDLSQPEDRDRARALLTQWIANLSDTLEALK